MTILCSAVEIETLDFVLHVYLAQAFMTPFVISQSQCLEKKENTKLAEQL